MLKSVGARVGLNLNFEFESAHELLMNLNFVFSKSMNLNFKIRKKMNGSNPSWCIILAILNLYRQLGNFKYS